MIHSSALLQRRHSRWSLYGISPAILLFLIVTSCEPAPGTPDDAAEGPIALAADDVHTLAPTDAIATVLDLEPLSDGSV